MTLPKVTFFSFANDLVLLCLNTNINPLENFCYGSDNLIWRLEAMCSCPYPKIRMYESFLPTFLTPNFQSPASITYRMQSKIGKVREAMHNLVPAFAVPFRLLANWDST